MGFDPLVNQRLLPPTFPRYTKIKTRAEAFGYFDDLLQQLRVICRVAEISDLHAILVRALFAAAHASVLYISSTLNYFVCVVCCSYACTPNRFLTQWNCIDFVLFYLL